MSRTFRRKHIRPHQWSYHAPWADWDFRNLLEECPTDPRVAARFHRSWRFMPHHSPAAVRRQIERRLRTRHRAELGRTDLYEEGVELTPYRWATGLGWWWGW